MVSRPRWPSPGRRSRLPQRDRRAARASGERMHEQACRPTADPMPSSSGCGLAVSSVFQPMCGIFSSGSAGVMRSTSPAIQPSPPSPVFAPALGHELHANADAEEPAASAHARVEWSIADGVETAAIGEGADAGQHHAVGARYLVGIAGHHDRRSCPTRAPPVRTPWRRNADCPSRSRRSLPSRRHSRLGARPTIEAAAGVRSRGPPIRP